MYMAISTKYVVSTAKVTISRRVIAEL